MPERTEYDVSAEDHRQYVDGENEAVASPVAVEIAGPVTVREFPAKSWAPTRYAVDVTVQQIASAVPQRTRLAVNNHGDNPVYLAQTRESCTIGSGFVLPPSGLPFEMFHSGPVFAVAESALETEISVYAEFRDA
jgi:hypothetical protein